MLSLSTLEDVAELANRSGLDGAELLAKAEDAPVRQTETDLTREAIDRQLFGAPFYFYRNEPFWGQDRLDLLEAALTQERAPIPFPAV